MRIIKKWGRILYNASILSFSFIVPWDHYQIYYEYGDHTSISSCGTPSFAFFLYEKCPWAIHKNDFQIFSWIPTCMLIYLILMLSFLLNCIEIWIRKLTSVSTFLVQNGIYSTMRLTWNLVVHVFSLKFRLGVRWNFSLLIYYDTYYTTDKSIYKWNDSFPLLQLGDNHQINFQKKSSFG